MIRHSLLAALVLVLLGLAPVLAQNALVHDSSPALNEVLAIANDFFDKLEKSDTQTAMKRLFEIFPLKVEAQDAFISDVTNLKTKLGTPAGHEFVGHRPVARTDRYFVTHFLTFHPRMPVAWELTFYRAASDGPWQLNYIRFDADDIPEFLQFTKLQFEALRSRATGVPTTPQIAPDDHLSPPPAPVEPPAADQPPLAQPSPDAQIPLTSPEVQVPAASEPVKPPVDASHVPADASETVTP
ncbi:MAG TPA: hypothetical protein PLP29_00945 [Candidatus Ozemobacteraceae bacterium]|nr:hypothetical protein [Candidatus Ozemobacteraceae bacterium]